MRTSISKTVLAGLAALTVSAPIALSNPAAAAFQFHGGGFGGFHGGFGGFHGGMGGFHSGGFQPGFGGFHSGFVRGPGFFHRGFVGRHVFFNRNVFVGGPGGCWGGWCGGGWWWPGVATGALIGAAAAYPYDDYGYDNGYGYGYGYGNGNGNGCWVYRPLYNRHGHYIGRHLVNLCY
jgi:hypothetical protein